MKKKIMDFLKSLIMRAEKDGVSFTKVYAWLAGLCAFASEINGALAQYGIAIPTQFLPLVKAAGILSAIFSIIKARDTLSQTSTVNAAATQQAVVQPPTQQQEG